MTGNRWRRRPAVLAAALLAANAAAVLAQGTHPISGRRIAPVMSHLGADWLDRPEREAEEAPDRAIDALAIRPGQVVADLGAGTGYFTVRLARRVGPEGRVFAVDIQREMLARLDARLAADGIGNVTTILGTADDPKLPAPVDLVLMVDVYHELSAPQVALRRIRQSLRPGGRLVLLEYRKEDPSIPIRPEHKMSVAEARLEVEHEGYVLAGVLDVLARQHILVFTVRGTDARP